MRLRDSFIRPALLAALALSPGCGDDGALPPAPTTPDVYPPQAVLDLALTYDPAVGAVVMSWTAPGDDIARDRVDRYDIRYGYAFPFDWERSTPAESPPVPLPAGAAQTFTLSEPARGRDLFASIRCFDAAGNESPGGAIAHLRVPGVSFEAVCLDALTDGPVAGLDVLVTSRYSSTARTGDDGRFAFDDLATGTAGVLIMGGVAAQPYHRFADSFVLAADVAMVYAMIPYQAPDSPLYDSIISLLDDALVTPGTGKVVKNWKQLPIEWYAPDFVNSNGLDYRALAVQAAARWNERAGVTIFTPVPSPPATGVTIAFLPRSVMGVQNGITQHTNDADGYPLLDSVRIVDDFGDAARLYSILMHELGHAVRLGHLPAGFLMYGGQPLPADITADEAAVARLLVSLPGGVDLAKYDPTPPSP